MEDCFVLADLRLVQGHASVKQADIASQGHPCREADGSRDVKGSSPS
jgi:hypothetical protein